MSASTTEIDGRAVPRGEEVVVRPGAKVKLGGAIKFIPYPIVTGFTSGIAVIIFSTQIRDLFKAPDWHPTDHPFMPDIVSTGRKPGVAVVV